jgi:hypothetical protein
LHPTVSRLLVETDENWKHLWKIIERFESSLKADIGIFDMPAVGASPYQEKIFYCLMKSTRKLNL